jgi:hypothetical protein
MAKISATESSTIENLERLLMNDANKPINTVLHPDRLSAIQEGSDGQKVQCERSPLNYVPQAFVYCTVLNAKIQDILRLALAVGYLSIPAIFFCPNPYRAIRETTK